MLTKIVTLFLVGMMVVALFSRFRNPPQKPPQIGRFCPHCGRPRLGTTPCDCGGGLP